MPYTLDDLTVWTLRKLGEIGDGQAPTPESSDKVSDALPGILADLEARGVYTRRSFDVVDDAAIGHLSDAVAAALATSFGVAGDEIVVLASQAQAAEGKLRVLRARSDATCAPPACYF